MEVSDATIDVAIAEDVWGPDFERLSGRYRVVREPASWRDRSRLTELVGAARVLVVRNQAQIDASLLAAAGTRLRLVCRAGAGLDNIDIRAAEAGGIEVLAAPGMNAASVAELALALALNLARRVSHLDRDVRNGGWDRRPGIELAGGIWGVVGLGATGVATAALASRIGMEVIAHDPYVTAEAAGTVSEVRLCGLDELREHAQVVSLHVPLTETTRHLVDRGFLLRMRRDAFLINLSRGELVDESALADAIDEGQLAGAGLDVREHEPPSTGRLERYEQVVLTPHVAGLTTAAQERIVAHLYAGIVDFLESTTPRKSAP